jgi:hypothetical protein
MATATRWTVRTGGKTPAAGHPSVEAFLRALTPPELSLSILAPLFRAAKKLTEAEQKAAADLFIAFEPDDPALFHPSLLQEEAPWGDEGELLPCSLWALVDCESRYVADKRSCARCSFFFPCEKLATARYAFARQKLTMQIHPCSHKTPSPTQGPGGRPDGVCDAAAAGAVPGGGGL